MLLSYIFASVSLPTAKLYFDLPSQSTWRLTWGMLALKKSMITNKMTRLLIVKLYVDALFLSTLCAAIKVHPPNIITKVDNFGLLITLKNCRTMFCVFVI